MPKTFSPGEILTAPDVNEFLVNNVLDVISVTKRDAQVNSLAGGATAAISNLTISHSLTDSSNRVVLMAQISGTTSGSARSAGVYLTAGGTPLNIGDVSGDNRRVSANLAQSFGGRTVDTTVLVFVFSPETTDAVTYGVSLLNVDDTTQTIFVNRSVADADGRSARAACSLTLVEVSV
jgi:hypothetical protein